MTARVIFALLGAALFIPSLVRAETLGQRFDRFQVSAAQLFHKPRNRCEESLLQTGQALYWQRYGRGEAPRSEDFKGYILFADPYHVGLQRVSFLLGSDCSNFVHRLYQVLGAPYAYTKTRHFIRMAEMKAKGEDPEAVYRRSSMEGYPIDLLLTEWLDFARKFSLVEAVRAGEIHRAALVPGDVIVFVKGEGPRGENGHVALVKSVAPLRVLHSANPRLGLLEAPFEANGQEYFVLRWNEREPLLALPPRAQSVLDLLDAQYPEKVLINP